MMKKILLVGLCFTFFSQAKMLNAIALTVDNEIITTKEIHTLQKKLHLKKAQAIDLLIQDRLQNIAMKNIVISEKDVDTRIVKIATHNHMSVKKMQKIIKQSGTKWLDYRKSIKSAMQKTKFFQERILPNIPSPSEDELKHFYQTHTSMFVIPSRITMTQYRTKSEKTIQRFLKTKKTKGLSISTIHKKTKSLNPELRTLFLGTQNGHYTKMLNTGSHYIVYKVKAKTGKYLLPFVEAKELTTMQWKKEQQDKTLKDYFAKMKTNTHIQIIRK